MLKREEVILRRLADVITAVPNPQVGGGTQSAAYTGYISYAQDMMYLVRKQNELLQSMVLMSALRISPPDIQREYKEGVDYINPSAILKELEDWVANRSANNWGLANGR